MKHTNFFRHLTFIILFVLFCSAGCINNGSDNETDNSTAIITASPENGPTVQAAIKRAELMLKIGADIDTILADLEKQMMDDPQVYDVEIESELESVSMVFNDGETHTIRLSDVDNSSDNGSDIYSLAEADPDYDLDSPSPLTDEEATGPFQKKAAGQDYYRMPANNKALLLNGYVLYHGRNGESKNPKVVLTDSTEVIETMLSARGYDVERPDGTINVGGNDITIPVINVDIFKTLTDYGVIVIETHGGKRELEYPHELFGSENCGGAYSKFAMLTTELVTQDNLLENAKDIFCGRLTIHDWIIREKGKKPRLVGQFYMVTPNYIRMYAQGNFPDNTLMIMNTCSSYNKDMSSPMKNLLFEKSGQGARFLGWNGKALVSGMGRTALNLFQLMTASNEELTVKNLKALEKSTPPQGGEFTALERALDELKQKSYLTDPKTGATLELSKQGSENTDLILMPHPLDIYRSSSNDPFEMTLYCANKPTSTIDSTEVSLENIVGTGWKLSVPVTAYGDLVITDGERESIPRPIHRWKPQFKIKYTGANYGAMPFMQLNGTLTLQARAGMGSCFRDSVWNDPPTAVFDAPWDLEVSSIGWSISGAGKDEGGNNYQYSGSDIATLKAKNGTGSMWSFDGETLSLQVCCDDLKYNLTLKAADGTVGSFDSSTNMCATIFYKSDVLSDDWSVEKGSYHDDIYELQIDWNAFSPEPLFDEENEPR